MDEDLTCSYHSFPDAAAREPGESMASPDSYTVVVGALGRVEMPTREIEIEAVEEDDLSSIDENYEVASIASTIEDQLTWRGRMQVVLHSNACHLAIIVLTILDVLIVLFELLLDVGALGNIVCLGGNFLEQIEFCHFHQESRDMCAPTPRLVLQKNFICSNSSVDKVACVCGFRKGRTVCIPRTESNEIDLAMILHVVSLLILTVFIIEVVLKLIAFRLKYFTHKFEVFDGMIVVISWMLDFASLLEEEAFQAISLLIVLRLWRVVRVINGSVLSSLTRSNAELHRAKLEAKRIIHAFHKAQTKLEVVQGENSQLREKVKRSGEGQEP